MPVHRKITGGEQYLPFAESKLRQLVDEAAGMGGYGVRKFDTGDARIYLEVAGDQHFIYIEGGIKYIVLGYEARLSPTTWRQTIQYSGSYKGPFRRKVVDYDLPYDQGPAWYMGQKRLLGFGRIFGVSEVSRFSVGPFKEKQLATFNRGGYAHESDLTDVAYWASFSGRATDSADGKRYRRLFIVIYQPLAGHILLVTALDKPSGLDGTSFVIPQSIGIAYGSATGSLIPLMNYAGKNRIFGVLTTTAGVHSSKEVIYTPSAGLSWGTASSVLTNDEMLFSDTFLPMGGDTVTHFAQGQAYLNTFNTPTYPFNGVQVSYDGGANFSAAGVPPDYDYNASTSVITIGKNTLVMVYRDRVSRVDCLVRSTDAGLTWEFLGPLPVQYITELGFTYVSINTVTLLETPPKRIDDPTLPDLDKTKLGMVFWQPAETTGTNPKPVGYYLYLSEDGGATWKKTVRVSKMTYLPDLGDPINSSNNYSTIIACFGDQDLAFPSMWDNLTVQ